MKKRKNESIKQSKNKKIKELIEKDIKNEINNLDKYMVSIPQNEFQSFVNGENISVPRKHNTPLFVAFQAPIFLVSNKMNTSWMDNSLKKRFIIIPFPKYESDPHLNQKIVDQMPE